MNKILGLFGFFTSLGGILYLLIIWSYLFFSGQGLILIGEPILFVLVLEIFFFIITILVLITKIREEIINANA